MLFNMAGDLHQSIYSWNLCCGLAAFAGPEACQHGAFNSRKKPQVFRLGRASGAGRFAEYASRDDAVEESSIVGLIPCFYCGSHLLF
jgi:hypothetical protein